jgi:hypothetical protein
VQLRQAGRARLDVGRGRQVEQQGHHLGAQEVVRAGRAQRRQARVLGAGEELQDHVGVGEVPDLRPVVRGDPAQDRRQGRGPGAPLLRRQRLVPGQDGAERLGARVLREVRLGRLDDPARVRLGLGARGAPRGDAVPAQDATPRGGVLALDRGDVQAELEPGTPPGHPDDLGAVDPAGQLRTVGGAGDRDPRVGVQVVDVGRVDEGVHGRVDRRHRTAPAVQAVVERGDHLVLALQARVHALQGAHAVQAQDGEAGPGEGAQVAPGTLDPQQLHVLARDGVGRRALGRGVAPGVVGEARVRAERVRARQQLLDHSCTGGGPPDDVGHHAPQPAWWPPTRSAAVRWA